MNSGTSRSYFPLLILQMAAIVILLLFAVRFVGGPWDMVRWGGLALMVVAGIFLFTARFQLGRSFSVTPQARGLVTTGLYSKIRNPMYLFSGLTVLGFFITLRKPYLFVLLAVMVVAQIIRARQEAQVLENMFGDQYREYRRQTWF